MFDSIRTKLTFWYAGVLSLSVITFALLTYVSVSRILLKETDENLSAMAKNFASAVNAEESGEIEKVSPDEAIGEIIKEFKFQDYQLFIYSTDGKLIAKTSDEDFPSEFPGNSYGSIQLNNRNYRVFASYSQISDENYKILIFKDLAEHRRIKNLLFYLFLIFVPLTILAAVLFGYLLARRSLKPIAEMSRTAQMISAKNLHERLEIENEHDELGSLASVFNDLLERLEESFKRQKRFTADASHELRTPLAIVRGESEVVLSKEDRSTKELRESLEIVNDESKRLTKIVEDLFTLSRADSGQFQANFRQVYLDEILADCVRRIKVLADKKKLSLEIETEETEISGDEQLLPRLFLNLLDNAVKYNRKNGKILVKLFDKKVTIADTGNGIPKAEQAKIFERFYRSDKVRSRSENSATSGAGLGLSIARWIAELHHAELKLSKSNESGSEFTVKFSVEK